MTGLAFVCGVLPMVIATGAGGASQQALGTGVMGGMIAVVILALLMVPVFFVSVMRFFGRGEAKAEAEAESAAAAEPMGRRRAYSNSPASALLFVMTMTLRRVISVHGYDTQPDSHTRLSQPAHQT
jgi:uncharacterized membrane protein